jgi:hypothetical protein
MCRVLQVLKLQREIKAAEEPPAALEDMLLIAFNMARPVRRWLQPESAAVRLLTAIKQQTACHAWRQWVALKLDADLAGALFLSADKNQDIQAIRLLDRIKPEAVPAVAVNAALTHAVQQKKAPWLAVLCNESFTKACDTDVVSLLMVEAARQGNPHNFVQTLIKIPGLQQRLLPAQVSSLMLELLRASVADAAEAVAAGSKHCMVRCRVRSSPCSWS